MRKKPESWWDNHGLNEDGTRELAELLGNKIFIHPKPTLTIKYLLDITLEEGIILDFFSGSGTLAHAVLELNKEDHGKRKFICVQLPEKCDPKSEAYKAGFQTIADISKERVRRVIRKMKEQVDSGDKQQDLGFKVFKLSESNFKQWQPQPKNTEALTEQIELFINPLNGEPTNEAMSFELLLKSGLDLNSTIEPKEGFYLVNKKELALVLEKTTESVWSTLVTYRPQKVIALDTVFQGNDRLKTNVALQCKDAGIDFKTI